ncbi:8385_t:CDS:1, partial [Racocetra fulgida]
EEIITSTPQITPHSSKDVGHPALNDILPELERLSKEALS